MNSVKKIIKKSKDSIKRQILLVRELPFAPLSDRSALISGRDQQIPKIVYQTFRENSFGKTHLKEIYRFRNLNPDLAFMFFDEEHRDAWMEKNFRGETILDIYKRSSLGPSKADIFRYCIIYKLGGYYFDISKGCTTPLTELHDPESQAVISFEKNPLYYPPDSETFKLLLHPDKYILQWGFGFIAGHIILEKVIKSIEADYHNYKSRIFNIPKTGVLMFTATGRFTKVVREVLAENPELNLEQAGIDFNGFGIFEMPGSRVRYLISPAYGAFRDDVIVK